MTGLERGAASDGRAPWTRDEWRAEATESIAGSLAATGRPATGPIEEVRAWCLSYVLHISTADGAVFFKATADTPLFVDEGHVMCCLSRLFPRPHQHVVVVASGRRRIEPEVRLVEAARALLAGDGESRGGPRA